MAISRYFTTPCVIATPSPYAVDSTTDADGVPQVDADTTETYCHVQPLGAVRDLEELVLGRDEAKRARRIWLPATTPVTHASTVTIGTDRYAIAGDPDTWSVGSASDHIAAVIVRYPGPTETTEASS